MNGHGWKRVNSFCRENLKTGDEIYICREHFAADARKKTFLSKDEALPASKLHKFCTRGRELQNAYDALVRKIFAKIDASVETIKFGIRTIRRSRLLYKNNAISLDTFISSAEHITSFGESEEFHHLPY